MRILLTGAKGFIGSYLIQKLLEKEENTITSIDDWSGGGFRVTYKELFNNKPSTRLQDLGYMRQDVANFRRMRHVANNQDIVVHLAANMPKFKKYSPTWNNKMFLTNVVGTQNIISECIATQTNRIIFTSSASVYGQHDEDVDETFSTNPVSPYGIQKLLAEKQLSLAAQFGIRATILRLFNVYGPFQVTDAIIPAFAKSKKSKPAMIHGGSQVRDFVYVKDVVDVINTIVEDTTGIYDYEVINVGTGIGTSIKDLVELYEKLSTTNPSYVKFKPILPNDIIRSVANPDHATDLGLITKTTLSDGLTETIGSYDMLKERDSHVDQYLKSPLSQ
jgi:nucleoside-diphosphate-sugar epimerase